MMQKFVLKRKLLPHFRYFSSDDIDLQGKYGFERVLPHVSAHKYDRHKTPSLFTEALETEDDQFDKIMEQVMGKSVKTDPTSVAAAMPEGKFRLTRKAY